MKMRDHCKKCLQEKDTRNEMYTEAANTSCIRAKLISETDTSGGDSAAIGVSATRSTWRGVLAQCFATGGVLLVAASCGMPIGYSAVLLPQLQSTNNSLMITEELGSWIASVHSAATPVGSLLSGILMDRFGRKHALQLSILPLVAGWTLIATADSHALILTGRIIAGLAVGSTATPAQVYISEIAEPHVRGVLGSAPMISYSLGILLVYALGSTVDWRTVAGLSTILPLTALLAFVCLPESPVWLVRNARVKKAARAMDWLRGGSACAQTEIQQIEARISKEDKTRLISQESYARSFFKPQVLKPFLILNVFFVLQVLSGTYLVVFYAVDIIAQIGGTEIDNFFAAVITAVVRLLFTVVAAICLTFIGRRTLAIASGLGTAISALSLGAFLYFKTNDEITVFDFYITVGCILFYVASNTTGLMVLPGLLLGELLPANVRGLAGGITSSVFNFTLFAVAKMFPLIKYFIGVHGVFCMFGISSLVLSLFTFLLLPETKGRSLTEIEDYFSQKNYLWVTRNRKRNDSVVEEI